MRIAAFIGDSDSGKTTLVTALIAHFVARGERVAAIKHTHHPVNDRREGDSERFLRAGAAPVIFAGGRDAIIFTATGARVIVHADPAELLAEIEPDAIVLVEGFKRFAGWPRIFVRRAGERSLPDDRRAVVAMIETGENETCNAHPPVNDRWLSSIQQLRNPPSAELASFLDTIWGR